MKKIKIAITGSIGSGKSIFAEYINSKGFAVIDADSISKSILSSDTTIKRKVIEELGEKAYSGGEVNKKYLAKTVFSDPQKLTKLNNILHPAVLNKINALVQNNLQEDKLIFIESALIYEADIEKQFDYVVLITSDYENRLKRSVQNNRYTEDDFKKRDENQIPDDEKEKRADFVFSNNGSKEDLLNKADLLLITLNAL